MSIKENQRPSIDKIYLYTKHPLESKYQLLINRREKVWTEKLKNPKAFIDYPQTIDDVYENLEEYNPTVKRQVLIVFDDMIAGMKANKKLSPVITEWFLRGRKLGISLAFISQSYFKVCKTIRLNATHHVIKKTSNKRELQQIALNHSSDFDFKDFIKLCK